MKAGLLVGVLEIPELKIPDLGGRLGGRLVMLIVPQERIYVRAF